MTYIPVAFIGFSVVVLAIAFGLHVLWWHNPRRKP